jgi:hypothetical protein
MEEHCDQWVFTGHMTSKKSSLKIKAKIMEEIVTKPNPQKLQPEVARMSVGIVMQMNEWR